MERLSTMSSPGQISGVKIMPRNSVILKLGKKIYEHTGTPIHPMSPLCKLMWMKDNQPDIFANAYKFISIKEYIWFHFFGKFQVDYSIASGTGLFDIQVIRMV